jgi:CRP-like cAMP-binding protein
MDNQTISSFQTFVMQNNFITEEDCKLFEPHLKIKNVKAKENILTEGAICKELIYIVKGFFRTFYLNEGKEINTTFFFENDFVFEYDSFLQNTSSKYFVQCMEDAEVITFSQEVLLANYNKSKNWERFGRIMAEACYKKMNDRMESFLFLNGEQRYKLLVKNEPHILDRVPLYHIASYLGLERESLSRLRKKTASQ